MREIPDNVFDDVVEEGGEFRWNRSTEKAIEFEIEKVYIDEAGIVLIDISEELPYYGKKMTGKTFFELGESGTIEEVKLSEKFRVGAEIVHAYGRSVIEEKLEEPTRYRLDSQIGVIGPVVMLSEMKELVADEAIEEIVE